MSRASMPIAPERAERAACMRPVVRPRPRGVPLLAVAVVAAILAVVWPAAALATFPGRSGRLLYDVGCCEAGAVSSGAFTVGPDGKGNRVWPIAREVFAPEWSPDGRRVLFSTPSGVWLARANGSHARRVARIPDGSSGADNPTWLPDGRRIAFTASFEEFVAKDPETGEEDFTRSRTYVFVVAVDGAGEQRLRQGYFPTWSPVGRRLAVVVGSTIRVTAPTGRHPRTMWRGRSAPVDLDFSPDGARIAFLDETGIRVLDTRTRRTKLIVSRDDDAVNAVVWAPDGSRLAYLFARDVPPGTRAPADEIWTVRPDGRGKRRLFRIPGDRHADHLSWQALH